VDRRLRILLFAIIMGFLVFSMLFQMMFNTTQRHRQHGMNVPTEQAR
jgi:hypothetical protein